jgi:TRAP-type C4-dicarboxylate transport system permease small subunit
VRVRLILDWLPAPLSRIVDMCAVAVSLALAIYLTWAIGHLTWAAHVDGTRSFQPSNSLLWPFQAVVTVGSVLFSAQLFAYLVRQFRGEPPELTLPESANPQ